MMTTSTGKTGVTNLIVIAAVVAVVAGAVWLRAQRAAPATDKPDTPTKEFVPGSDGSEAADTVAPTSSTDEAAASGLQQPEGPTTTTQPTTAKTAKLPRLVDLGADKCASCKKLAPILDALREEYKGRLSVEFIDVWKDPDARTPYKIRVIPTQILFNAAGEEVWRHEGFIAKADLEALFAEKVGVKARPTP